MTYTARTIIPRILQFVRPYAGLIVLSFCFNLLFAGLNTLVLAIVDPVFKTLFQAGSGSTASLLPSMLSGVGTSLKQDFDAVVFGIVIGPDYFTTIRNLSIAIFVLFFFRSAAKYASAVISTRLEEGVMKSIRDTVYRHITSLSMDFFTRKRAGDVMSLLTNDVGVLNHATINSITTLWRESATVVINIIVLLIISAKLTGIAVVISLLGLVLIKTSSQYLKKYARRMQGAQADYTTTLQESILGVRVIKALGIEQFVNDRFVSQTASYVRSALKNTKVMSLVPAVNDTFGILALVSVFFAGGAALANGELEPSSLMTFLFLLFGLMQPISTIVSTIAGMQRGMVAASNVLMVLDERPTVVPGTAAASGFRESLRVEGVSFAYGDTVVVDDVSLTIRRGQTVALVGASGSGKSTMLDLLMRFHDPRSGAINLDGTDIRTFDPSSYRRLFGTVSQETLLFNDTIANNIALGEAEPDMERLEHVARIAHAHDFIMAMADGYSARVGDRGITLSGGQRQRIAIARALYRNPDILIFDEATSALDTASERVVQDAIASVLEDRTAIVVAHRLSTILSADCILVFDHGKIVERGTHAELLAADGVYARLYHLQFSDTERQSTA